MSGICGIVKNNSNENVNSMLEAMLLTNRAKKGDRFQDGFVDISEIKLKSSNNSYIAGEDFVIFANGEIYNFDVILEMFSINGVETFEELLFYALRSHQLKEILNKIDGLFSAVIYDRLAQKVFLISDRHGFYYMYYYFSKGSFAFGAEVKALLALRNVWGGGQELDVINKKAFDCFMELGYFIEDWTWFENIKLLNPSTILTFDLKDRSMHQERYWSYGEIKQSNMDFDTAVDKMAQLLKKSMKKRYKEKVMVPISGGLDSRLNVAGLNDINPALDLHCVTVGQEGCDDIRVAEQIAKKLKQNHLVYCFEKNDNLIENRSKFAWLCDGMFSIKHTHGIDYLVNNTWVKNGEVEYFFGGWIGGEIYGRGESISRKFFNQRASRQIVESYFKLEVDNINFLDSYYNISHFHPFVLDNLCRKFTFAACAHMSSYVKLVVPLLDNELLDFIFSLPDEYREKNIYYKALLKAYPELYSLEISSNSGFQKEIPKYYSSKFQREVVRIFRQIKNVFRVKEKQERKPLYDYEHHITSRGVKESIERLLRSGEDSCPLQKQIMDYYERYCKQDSENYIDNNQKLSEKLLQLVTIKLYFSKVFERG